MKHSKGIAGDITVGHRRLSLPRCEETSISCGMPWGRPHPASARADLARTAAGITGLVAIIQHDRGEQHESHGWFATAERAARESGDRQMLAWVLARYAMVPLNYGAPKAAAQLAIRARAEAGGKSSSAAALAAAVTARALAATGDRQGALRAVTATRVPSRSSWKARRLPTRGSAIRTRNIMCTSRKHSPSWAGRARRMQNRRQHSPSPIPHRR